MMQHFGRHGEVAESWFLRRLLLSDRFFADYCHQLLLRADVLQGDGAFSVNSD